MNDNNQPVVTIITPVYNGAKYIRQCIESVIAQDYNNIEYIVVDDGSTDSTMSILGEYNGVIRVISQKNMGANHARNVGIASCQGLFVKFLDHDDYLDPRAISNQIKHVKNIDQFSIIYGYNIRVKKDSNSIVVKTKLNDHGYDHVVALLFNNIMTSNPLYPIDCLKKVGGFNIKLHSRQEWALNILLASFGYKFEYRDDLIYFQRDHYDIRRISNIKRSLNDDLENFDNIYNSIIKSDKKFINEAWAAVLWGVARHYYYYGERLSGKAFEDKAKEISPNGYMKFWSFKYKIAYNIFGSLLTEKIFGIIGRKN